MDAIEPVRRRIGRWLGIAAGALIALASAAGWLADRFGFDPTAFIVVAVPSAILLAVPTAWLTARTWAGYVLAGAVSGLVGGVGLLALGLWVGGIVGTLLGALGVMAMLPALLLGALAGRGGRPRGPLGWLMRKDEPPEQEAVGVVYARSPEDARHRELAQRAHRRARGRPPG